MNESYFKELNQIAASALCVAEADKELSTEDYMKVWNLKHNLEREYAVKYAAYTVGLKTANSDMCLEAFK